MGNEFNIEEVMDEIRKEIKEKGLTSDMLSFSDVTSVSVADDGSFSKAGLDSCLANLSDSYVIRDNRQLSGNPIVVFIKRVIRKLTRFYVKPIVDAQTEFNAYTVQTANMLSRYVCDDLEKTNTKQLEEKIELLELKLRTAIKENNTLHGRIDSLEARLSSLERK
jgi:hypothetical protein